MKMKQDVSDRLRAVSGFVFDLDGTLVLGDRHNKGLRPLPGALAIIECLSQAGFPFLIVTNGTTRTPQQYAETLRSVGFSLHDGAVQTPSSVAADYFVRRKYKRVMALGVEGVWGPIAQAGLEIVPPVGQGSADAVYVGWCPDFKLAELESACHAVWQGARLFIASHAPFFATAQGKTMGTSRAIGAMITSLTGRRAMVLGKPSAAALKSASRSLGVAVAHLAVVGDDPAMEVPMALHGGALAIAVCTGVGGEEDYRHLPAERQPHLVLPGVGELLNLLADGAFPDSVSRGMHS